MTGTGPMKLPSGTSRRVPFQPGCFIELLLPRRFPFPLFPTFFLLSFSSFIFLFPLTEHAVLFEAGEATLFLFAAKRKRRSSSRARFVNEKLRLTTRSGSSPRIRRERERERERESDSAGSNTVSNLVPKSDTRLRNFHCQTN